MRLCVLFVALLLGDFALARGVQALRARAASRIAQALGVQQIVSVSSILQQNERTLDIYFLSASGAKDTPDGKPSDGVSPDSTPDSPTGYYRDGVYIVEPYPMSPSWERPGSPDGIPPLDKPQRMPDGYLPSSESSDGGSPDSIRDPITGYSRGGGGSGGGPDDTNYNPITGY